MKKKTKIKFWTTLGMWQYDLLYYMDKTMRLSRRYYRQYSEKVWVIFFVLLFLIVSWGTFFYLFNILFGDQIDLVGELL
jgi:hypothetical protein